MTRYLIFGSGHIGPAITRFLIDEDNTEKVTLVDKDDQALQALLQKFLFHKSRSKIKTFCMGSTDPKIAKLFFDVDMIIAAMPWAPTFELIKKTRAFNIPFVSITRPHYDDFNELVEIVSSDSSSVVVGCGLEPGLTEIMSHRFISMLPDTKKLNIYCGGISTAPNPPLFYKQVFGDELPLSERVAYQVKFGKLVAVERFSEVEEVVLENIGTFEAWHDGMSPDVIRHFNLKKLTEINQKTLRWLGFSKTFSVLKALGFLGKSSVRMKNGMEVTPYELTQTLLKEHAYFNHAVDRDTVVLHIRGQTDDGNVSSVTLQGFYDDQFNLTAMASITGCVAAIGAKTLFEKKLTGLIYPEELFADNYSSMLFNKLEKYGVKISKGGS